MVEYVSEVTIQEELRAVAVQDILKKELKDICIRADKRRVIRNNEYNRIEHDFFLENIQNKTDTLGESLSRLKKEENLSKELMNLKKKEITDLKMRQHVRETSDELRQIEAKLRAAYVQKAVAAQIAEKEYLKTQDKLTARKADQMLVEASSGYEELLRKKAEEDIMKKYHYKQELQDQIIMNLKEKQYQYEEFLREKKTIDTIVQRIHDEDRMEMENKMRKMNKTKQEIETFKAFQEMWKQKEREALEAENKRIIEFMLEKEKQQKESQENKLKEAVEKEAVLNKLATKMYSDQVERNAREQLIQDLLVEEARERDEQKLKEDIEKALQLRIDSQNMMAMQMEEKKERLKREELEEAQFRQQLMDKILQDEKLEQLSAEKRRRKIMEYRRDIEDTIKARRLRRAEELRHLLFMQEEEKLKVENRKKIIEEERLRLLKQHAQHLIGFLPSGLLREEDLPHLGTDVINEYKKM